jgi:hypothetical protein
VAYERYPKAPEARGWRSDRYDEARGRARHIGGARSVSEHVAGVRTSSYEVAKSGVVVGRILQTADIVLQA